MEFKTYSIRIFRDKIPAIPSPIGLEDIFPRDHVLVSIKPRMYRGVEWTSGENDQEDRHNGIKMPSAHFEYLQRPQLGPANREDWIWNCVHLFSMRSASVFRGVVPVPWTLASILSLRGLVVPTVAAGSCYYA